MSVDRNNNKALAHAGTAALEVDAQLLDAIEALTDGFILWDAEDRVVLCNSAFRNMDTESYLALRPGTRFEDIMRARVYAGKIPAARGREEDYIRERLARHRNPTGEPIIQQLSSGQWVRIIERRTRDGSIVSIRSDITQIQRDQETLRLAKEEVEAANRAKSSFLATMSHELRTPLNAIIGFSEMMQARAFGPLGSPRYEEYAGAINVSGRHLLSLIGDILDMSRIEAGRYELRPEPLDIAALVEECLLMLKGRAGAEGVALSTTLETGRSRLRADRLAVKQVLLNLLSNSVKFTPRGGGVCCTSRLDAEGGVVLAVIDTGVGIAAKRLPQIFEPFSSAGDNALVKPGTSGTGLGLSICRRLAELHGARIELASVAGSGTTATLRFPARLTLEA
jgi:two-component system cell cycle sensor histidine kinase PleC